MNHVHNQTREGLETRRATAISKLHKAYDEVDRLQHEAAEALNKASELECELEEIEQELADLAGNN